ncbi:MAG: efflux RND transporter periplasmic adaptor subunit [Thermogutta sp.]
MNILPRFVAIIGIVLDILLITGCETAPSAAPPPGPPEVAVYTVETTKVRITTELPGRTASYLVSEIRPQVNGVILKRFFEEGSEVKAGDVLYQIDPAPYQAAYDVALANLKTAQQAVEKARAALEASMAAQKEQEALFHLARTNRERYERMYEQLATTAMERDQAVTNAEVAEAALLAAKARVETDRKALAAAEAAVQQAEAALEAAKINLDYTQVKAPISGRIGRSRVTEGAIVTAYQSTPLATIQQFDPIYVDIPQSTSQLYRLRRALQQGRLKAEGTDKVKIILEDGTIYPHEATLKFRDVSVDPGTESVIVRVIVPNPEGELLPGMFVRASIELGEQQDAILVPQQAVQRDSRGEPFVWVVDDQNKVHVRSIVTDRAFGHRWLVLEGLKAGERIVMEGMQRLKPDMVVNVVPWVEPSAAASQESSRGSESANGR